MRLAIIGFPIPILQQNLIILIDINYMYLNFSGSSSADRPQSCCENPEQTEDQESWCGWQNKKGDSKLKTL